MSHTHSNDQPGRRFRVKRFTGKISMGEYRLASQLSEAKKELEVVKKDRDEALQASGTDALTGIWNRRGIERQIDMLNASIVRHNDENDGSCASKFLGIILIDIDHFKSVNDRYGHTIGDEALMELARRLMVNKRQNEIVGRWGGEEFAVVLETKSTEDARAAAERFRKIIADKPFSLGCGADTTVLNVTASMGVAVKAMTRDDNEWRGIFDAADSALYRAKNNGRNRVLTEWDAIIETATSIKETTEATRPDKIMTGAIPGASSSSKLIQVHRAPPR